MLKRKYQKGGLIEEERARVNISGEGGRDKSVGSVGFGRIGVSIPVGKDAEIEPYVQGPVSSRFGSKGGQVGVSFMKKFARGGVVKGWKK